MRFIAYSTIKGGKKRKRNSIFKLVFDKMWYKALEPGKNGKGEKKKIFKPPFNSYFKNFLKLCLSKLSRSASLVDSLNL